MKPNQSKKFRNLNFQIQDQKLFRLIIFSIVLFGSFVLFGAEKTYAATNNFTADGGEWNTAGNWSLGHVPDNTEDATFTGIVTAGVTLTVTSGNAYAKSIDFSTAGATFTFSYSSQVTSYGSVTLKTGMTMSQSGYMSFNINGSGTLTTNGVAFPYAISLWSGADVTLADALTINNGGLAVNPYSGGDTTLITNNNNITLAGILTDNNSTGYVRLTLGSSTINCTNVVFGSASTLTVDSNTAAINITSTVDINANFGSKTWGGTTTVLMTGGKTFTLLGTNTFNKFAISWTSDHISSIFTLAANQTFTNSTSDAFKVTGASTISRPRIKSVSSGSQRTINAATINITGAVDFKDINADGTSAPWDLSGIDTGNQGGNSDIVFRTPATYYVSCGSTNTTYWNSSDIFSIANDGTADGLSVFPLPQDSSIINDSTWSDTGNTLQIVGNGFGNIDTSALTEAQTIILGSGDYFGDLILTGTSNNLTISSTAQTLQLDPILKYEGSDTLDINVLRGSNDSIGSGKLYIGLTVYSPAATGTVRLLSNLTTTGNATLNSNSFDLNGKSLTVNIFECFSNVNRTLQDSAGGGKIVVNGLTGTVFDMSNTTGLTVSNAPDIDIGDSNNTLTGDITFAGGGKTFGDFKVTKHAGNYDTLITGSNTFGSFTLETPDASYNYSDIQFTAGTTTTVTSFTATGTASYPININSSTNAAHTLSDTTGTNTAAYCTLTNSTATGGATWDASNESTNGGNNTGWILENTSATEFVSIVDPGNGTGTDYTSLSAWENAFGTIDLNSTNTKVFSGTTTGTLSESVTVYQCRSGVYQNVTGTLVHDTATQALVKNITAWASFLANDVWYTNNTCNSTSYYTISNTGDTSIAIAKCRATNGTADTAAVNIAGWTTSATNYIKVWTDPSENYRHQGKWDEMKYRLVAAPASTSVIYNQENYVRIDGLQIHKTSDTIYGSGIINGIISGTSNIELSNNIIKSVVGLTQIGQHGIAFYYNYVSGSKAKIWNNIIYDFSGNNSVMGGIFNNYDSSFAVYAYNNTVYNCRYGIRIYTGDGSIIAKNNLSYNNNDNYDGTFDASSTNNLSGPGTDANIPPTNKRDGVTVTFRDETNDDFHLAQADTGAKNQGILLYDSGDDPNLYFTTAIDGNVRLDSAGTWDIGADEAATLIYRSVGPEVTQVLSNGASNPLNISGSTASFNTGLPDNIGVGDVLEYDDDNDGDIDANDSIAFIHGRTDPTHFTIKTATGGNPTLPSAADEIHWNLNRAYTRLSYWEAGTENTLIDSDLRGFDTGNRDIAANNEQWNVACYANGTTADPGDVNISGWTTHRTNYLKIYTPYLDSEVGEPQRHQGVWTEGKYRIEDNNDSVISISEEFVRMEGLQVSLNYDIPEWKAIIYVLNLSRPAEVIINNNIIKRTGNGGSARAIMFYSIYDADNNSLLKVYNNIIYNTDYAARIWDAKAYFYNNTFYAGGIGKFGFFNDGDGAILVAKNNIVQNSTDGFSGSFDASSDYNLSNLADDAPGANSKNSTTVTFRDETNNDFHLTQFDTGAREKGTDLSSDPYLPFTDDIDRDTRHINQYWDIGADEEGGMIKAQFKGQHMFKGEVIFK